MLATVVFTFAILAVPAILVLAVLSMFGSLVAALADGRYSIVPPSNH